MFRPEIVKGVVIAQAGSYSRWLGKIDMTVDTEKDTVLNSFAKLIETKMDSSIYDRKAQMKVESMLAAVQGDLMNVIGNLESDWKRGFSEESNLGQWEADAVRNKVGTDIAFLNSGGIRKDLPKGEITINDIWEINPFGNTIVTFVISGKGLMQMIKNNIKSRVMEIDELGSSDMIIVSGIKVVYDPKKVLSGDDNFIEKVLVNGEEISDSKNYTVATNNYVGTQLKKYFGEQQEKITIYDTNIIDRDLMIEAVINQKNINTIIEKRVEDLSKQEIKKQ